MARTVLELDDALLAEAALALGTGSAQETVVAALTQGLERRRIEQTRRSPLPGGTSHGGRVSSDPPSPERRAAALSRLAARADAGDFDMLLDKSNYRH
jgi:Arc/MetJ family transcription regulator